MIAMLGADRSVESRSYFSQDITDQQLAEAASEKVKSTFALH